MGLPRATAFHFGQGHFEAVFNFNFNSRRDQNGRAKSTSWSVWQSCFWVATWRSERTQLLQKFARNHETTKKQEGWHKHPRAELGRTTSWSPKSQCVYGPENEIAAVTFFAKNCAALTKSNTLASVRNGRIPGNTVADWRSLPPPACCQSLPKHHVVWNCLGVVVAGFRNMAWVRCWFCCDIAGGMLFSVFALAVDRFVTIRRRTAQFCFGLLMCCLFLGSPPSPP